MTVPERLIDAATRLFADKGYERVAVQEIVERAGVTKGAMYHYFGSISLSGTVTTGAYLPTKENSGNDQSLDRRRRP